MYEILLAQKFQEMFGVLECGHFGRRDDQYLVGSPQQRFGYLIEERPCVSDSISVALQQAIEDHLHLRTGDFAGRPWLVRREHDLNARPMLLQDLAEHRVINILDM